MASDFKYLEELTYRVDLSSWRSDGVDYKAHWAVAHAEVIERLITAGVLVQVVPKQRIWKGLHAATEWIGKKIGIR